MIVIVYRGGLLDGIEQTWKGGEVLPAERLAFSYDGILDWFEYRRTRIEYGLSETRYVYEVQ